MFVCLSLLILMTGCADMETGWSNVSVQMSIQPTSLSAGRVSSKPVALVLNDELTSYHYEVQLMHNSLSFPLGVPLAAYAQNVTTNSFSKVQTTSALAATLTNSTAVILLIPRPVKASFSMGTKVQDPFKFALVVEWRGVDRISQNTIWLKTVTVEAVDHGGAAFSGMSKSANEKRRQLLMQALFNDLTLKTYDLFQKSSELSQ